MIFLKVCSAKCVLSKLDAVTKGTKRFSNSQALSGALAVLRTLQPQAFGSLNCLVTLILASNYYAVFKLMEQVPVTCVNLSALTLLCAR